MAKPRTPKPGQGFFADPKRQRKLRLLWSRGYSHASIAERFGYPCTRSTVAGAIHRLGIPTRKAQIAAAEARGA